MAEAAVGGGNGLRISRISSLYIMRARAPLYNIPIATTRATVVYRNTKRTKSSRPLNNFRLDIIASKGPKRRV